MSSKQASAPGYSRTASASLLSLCLLLAACGDDAAPASDDIALADITGVWGTEDVCGAEPLTIDAEFVSVADEACRISTVAGSSGGVTLELLCPAPDGSQRVESWTIAAHGAPPIEAIAISRSGAVAELTRCPAN